MVSALTHWASVLATYARRGEEGLDDVANRLHDAAHEEPGGKFDKKRARYLPQGPFPPTVWRTSCGRCRFYEEGEPGEPGRCHVVGREDDRYGGEAIHYRGWCAFWMPPAGEPAFAWIGERLHPDGKSAIRGKYDPPIVERERARRKRAGAESLVVREEPAIIEREASDRRSEIPDEREEVDEREEAQPDGG